MLSIVIPTFNEMKFGFLSEILNQLVKFPDLEKIEIICVDSNSADGTVDFIKNYKNVIYEKIIPTSRGARLDYGLKKSSNALVLFHHPRSLISNDALSYFLDESSPIHQDQKMWGGLTHEFDVEHAFLRFISFYSNKIRVGKKGIVYLDHCIFFHKKQLLQLGGVPDIDIFEDTAISEKMRKISHPIILPFISKTSAIRFLENGIYKQFITNQFLKFCYKINVPHDKMNKWYERNNFLNTGYK